MSAMVPGTSLDLRVYCARRDAVANGLRQISSIASRLGAGQTGQSAERSLDGLYDERFKIVVVGEFSRGKSTVVNALLGDRVLPAAVQPTTTVLNRITYGEQPAYRLVYRDERGDQAVTREEFMGLVAPPEPMPGDEESEREYQERLADLRRIAYAEIAYPTSLCRSGVEIVDTPGTNDLDPLREQITYDIIPQADAVIMVLSAKMILARTEMEFLQDRILKADIQRIFFVINFADHLRTEADRRKLLDYARANLRVVVPEPRLFLVCAKAALGHRRGSAASANLMPFEATGFLELEVELARFLTEERGATKLAKPKQHGLRLCDELAQGPLAVARATVGMGLEELERRIGQLEPDLARLRQERDQAIGALRTGLEQHGLALAQDVRRGLERVADVAATAVERYTGELNKDDIARAIERAVAPQQTALQTHIRERQESAIAEECGRAERRLQRAWDDLYISLDKVFEIRSVAVGDIDLGGGDEAPVAVFKTGMTIFGMGALAAVLHIAAPIAFVVAFFSGDSLYQMFKNQARSRVLGQVRAQVDRRYRDVIPDTARAFERDWRSLVDALWQQGTGAVNRNLAGLEEQLDRLVAEHRTLTSQAEERKQNLAGLQSELVTVQETLVTMGRGA